MTKFEFDMHSMSTGHRWTASCTCEEDVQPRVGDGILVVTPGVTIEIKSVQFQPLMQPRVTVRAWHMRLDDDAKVAEMLNRMRLVGWQVVKKE